MKSAVFVLPIFIALTACAAARGEPSDTASGRANSRVVNATPVGEPQNCVQLMNIRESRVLSDRVIDFHLHNGEVLRNVLPNSCPQLGFERAFAFDTSLSKLCNVDIITVINQGGGPSRGASCGLGMFQPVKLDRE